MTLPGLPWTAVLDKANRAAVIGVPEVYKCSDSVHN